MRRRIVLIAAILLAAAVAAAVWVRHELTGSLPVLDGTLRLEGLSAPVTVARDALGIPVIRGATREDVARATGFLHAQDRFFQMDLNRRLAAGELAALVGRIAVPFDREIRRHRFRAQATRAVSLLGSRDRALLDAYTAGVNSGLRALNAAPFEYLLLRQAPQPWHAEDSMLVVLAMFITLQDADGSYESALATMNGVLPAAMFEFMASAGTDWDAPIAGERVPALPVPGPEVYDLRSRRKGKPDVQLVPTRSALRRREAAIGSNNWVVAGRLTDSGAPMLANDMHLDVRVPNVWYRAQFEWRRDGDPADFHKAIGVTLPGAPAMVVGSNTFVAWGFTNTYADWSDIVLLDVDPDDPTRYRTPAGWQTFVTYDEVIEIAGEDDLHLPVTWTTWGPVLAPDFRGRPRAYRWVAHSAEQLAASVTPMESATTVAQAFDEANGLGAPGQNMVVADRDGHIGWTVYGSIPRRMGIDGRLPASWSDGTRGWDGWLADAEYPRVIDPPSGRIWTANARVVDGAMLGSLGDGGYEVGSRATIIRDRLMASERFDRDDMLGLQLDARAVFLARWRDLILETLTPAVVAQQRNRREFRDLVERSWDGHASPQSVGYRLTRMFREQVSEAVMTFVLSECYAADVRFDHTVLRRREGPIWTLITKRPAHLLDPQYASWDGLLIRAIDDTIARARDAGDLADRVWSEYNAADYRHPLARSIPFFGRWLNMPATPLPGDLFTVRMTWGPATASERLVVSPGREAEGIMHMPTGQSGHPLSPFYANSHDAWVRGEATPLLAGRENHRLTLTP